MNDRLVEYQSSITRIDYQLLLLSPAFDVLTSWRKQQKLKLRTRMANDLTGRYVMLDDEVDHFVQYVERLKRHLISGLDDYGWGTTRLHSRR